MYMYNRNQGNDKFKGIYTPIIIKYHRMEIKPFYKNTLRKMHSKKQLCLQKQDTCAIII